MTTPQMDWLDDQRRSGVLGAGFYGPTEGEKRRRRGGEARHRPLTGDCDGCPKPTDGCPGDCPTRWRSHQ